MSGDIKNVSVNDRNMRGRDEQLDRGSRAGLRANEAADKDFVQWNNNGCSWAGDSHNEGYGTEGHRAPAPRSVSHASERYPRRIFGGNRTGE